MHLIRSTALAAAGMLACCSTAVVAHAQDTQPGAGVTIQPVEGVNIEERFQHEILYRALRELGYEIADPFELEYQTIHLAVATGDGDFSGVHWDPLHEPFFEGAGGTDMMSRLGMLVEGALSGYLVDKASYEAGITNLGDLADPEVARRFDVDGDGKADLAGCVPGWGCELVVEHHLDEYGLRDTVTHHQAAYSVLMADVMARYEAGEPILYFTWTPYWVSGVLVPGDEVEWLEVPYTSLPESREANTMYDGKNLGFSVNTIGVIANNGFIEDNPAAERVFELAKIDINDISAQNDKIRNGEDSADDIERHVDEWISTHQDEFDSWVEAGREAAAQQ